MQKRGIAKSVELRSQWKNGFKLHCPAFVYYLRDVYKHSSTWNICICLYLHIWIMKSLAIKLFWQNNHDLECHGGSNYIDEYHHLLSLLKWPFAFFFPIHLRYTCVTITFNPLFIHDFRQVECFPEVQSMFYSIILTPPPPYLHGLTKVCTWISDCIHRYTWDGLTHPYHHHHL